MLTKIVREKSATYLSHTPAMVKRVPFPWPSFVAIVIGPPLQVFAAEQRTFSPGRSDGQQISEGGHLSAFA